MEIEHRTRWNDELHESAIQTYLDSQKYAEKDYIYVPFKTGVVIFPNKTNLVLSHLETKNIVDLPQILDIHTHDKEYLMTSEIFDCAVLTVKRKDGLKMLIHAYGVKSLETLLEDFTQRIPQMFSEFTYVNLAYNPRYLGNAILYECIFLRTFGFNTNLSLHQEWVSEKSVIRI